MRIRCCLSLCERHSFAATSSGVNLCVREGDVITLSIRIQFCGLYRGAARCQNVRFAPFPVEFIFREEGVGEHKANNVAPSSRFVWVGTGVKSAAAAMGGWPRLEWLALLTGMILSKYTSRRLCDTYESSHFDTTI